MDTQTGSPDTQPGSPDTQTGSPDALPTLQLQRPGKYYLKFTHIILLLNFIEESPEFVQICCSTHCVLKYIKYQQYLKVNRSV